MSDIEATGNDLTERQLAKAEYDRVVESAELRDIKLIRLNFDVRPKFFEVMSSDVPPEPVPTSSFDNKFENLSYDAQEGVLGAQILWSAQMKQSRIKLLAIEAHYIIVYENVAVVEERHALAFLKRVGRFATYPYYRALVSRLSAESGVNLPVLPILK